ncbi:aminodeoxychorismate synthase component I [Streptomyces turgidiscabies]|uniref:Aminodeoxychorismate synthase, component I n=2 Tax=Streptomyces TaxID=1883 RepID=L7EW48_STRT8|nr:MULTISPECIES: aminodeoxychorismate synthase component I [Streptomyces]ELP62600.1 aminodeoxychorismate synthase, component I [Streptomyces turgidiscabies Car8]MDX3499695.1 aminodeoxychorismate synthase component I [Streptomyces turgidiscabies]GAQ73360.1 aminodeoxychorismate synthase component 1 [Streptomyces turgidiscabies]
MTPRTIAARFDDLRSGTAWEFPRVANTMVATRPEQVAPVLAELERATTNGWWAFGFVSYEAASGLDPKLTTHQPLDGLPLVWFGVCQEPSVVRVVRCPEPGSYDVGGWATEWGPETHRERVEAVRRHIAAGETYQCNLTTRMSGEAKGELPAFYADLALGQKGSYNAYLDLGRFVVASASPELFFEIRDELVHMRPMKGTAPRGDTPAEDARIVAELRASAKERAENIMIVDLVRNDLARIATTGSVRVPSLCRAEQYETVHQLTSDVTAGLRPDAGLADVFRALFPCGSVTGAPKQRTMEIIRDLEDGPRGLYCGAVGMVAPAGAPFRARFSVAIRTVLIDRDTGVATYGTGGGITWGSEPSAEYAELQAKAEVLMRCLRPGVPG